jgi:outer membrane protein assembly factor BamA
MAFATTTESAASDKTDAAKTQTEGKKKKQVQYNEKGEIIKTGINLGPLPVVAFDADRGFQFGALMNIYDFGDGKNYPNPNAQWYFEGSAYLNEGTVGSFLARAEYDNKTLIPGVRMSVCAGYYRDAALDFYGFNGSQSIYDNQLKTGFYRFSRDLIRLKADFTGKITKNFFWEAGYNLNWVNTSSFTPKGYSVYSDQIEGGTTLFQLYKDWGIIPEDQANGGIISSVRAGLMYDSRNVENNPTKGIWAEAHVIAAPKWLGTSVGHYKFCATMRQYIPLGTPKVVFAYRLAYQGFFGNAPWYAMPVYTTMGPKPDYDGLGGYRTVRGIMLNRVQGLHTGFYNAEIRYRFIDFKLFNQKIALAVSGFTDGTHVFKGYDMTMSDAKRAELALTAPKKLALYDTYVHPDKKDGFHGSAGAGLRFIMNENFIVAFEYARCFNKQDGNGAFYINIGFLF